MDMSQCLSSNLLGLEVTKYLMTALSEIDMERDSLITPDTGSEDGE